MHIVLAIASALSFMCAFFALAVSRSDLQIGIAATALVGGFVLFGLAGVAARLSDIWKELRPRGR